MKRERAPREFISQEEERLLRRNRVITPSNIDIWFGHWRDDDELTQQQIRELRSNGFDPAVVEKMDVFVQTTMRQFHTGTDGWGRQKPQPWRRVRCPIVARRLDGRLKVITPLGDRKFVFADGSLSRRTAGR